MHGLRGGGGGTSQSGDVGVIGGGGGGDVGIGLKFGGGRNGPGLIT